MPQLAVVVHGKLGSWKTAASETKPNQTGLGFDDHRQAIEELRSFAHFTHDSLWQRIILPNRAHGYHVRVIIHLWNPELEDTMNQLFKPADSKFEPAQPRLNKVQSQHLSLKRALEMLSRLPGPTVDRVLATRPDLLVFNDLVVPSMHGAPDLWLPYHCVPFRLRLAPTLHKAHVQAMRAACSRSYRSGSPTGMRLQPPYLSRISPASHRCIMLVRVSSI